MRDDTERRLNTMCNLSEVVLEKGIEQGIEKGIEIYILANLEDGIDENIIISRLMKNFSLTEEKAKMYFEKYAYQNI